jgi:hypothetical protein
MASWVAAGEVLAQSLADHAAYWDVLGPLTPAQRRWRDFERELRTNMAAQGRQVPAANDPIIAEIRSGAWESRQRRNMQNLLRNRARLAQWKREGYSFDAEHRLVAPALTRIRKPVVRAPERPREQKARTRSTSSSRDGPSEPSDEPPLVVPLRGFRPASVRMVQHLERGRAKQAIA